MSTLTRAPALRAVEAILAELADAGITATHDAGAFYPQPVGVLVALPSLTSRGLASSTFEVKVLVVSGDPVNSLVAADRLYALADDVAFALRVDAYRPSQWSGNLSLEPLPAVELLAVLTVTYLQEVSTDG